MLSPTPHIALVAAVASLAFGDPYAVEVISYNPGSNPAPGYTNPLAVLGEPTRFTGQGLFPAVVSVFNPPWMADQIVSIGAGGHITVRFDSPVVDHPDHPFGIDIIIFSNTAFIDDAYPLGIVGGVFSDDGGIIELSADGNNWFTVPNIQANGLFPTIGYLDSGPYDMKPGNTPSDFTKPVDPSLTLNDFMGQHYDHVLALYNNSGGGTGVDIASAGLSETLYVRITNPPGAPSSIEIDAFARVAPFKPGIPGDLNGDGVVDVLDLLILLDAWGECDKPTCPADLNEDRSVDVLDLLILLDNWG